MVGGIETGVTEGAGWRQAAAAHALKAPTAFEAGALVR
jgi:hypothetical protein